MTGHANFSEHGSRYCLPRGIGFSHYNCEQHEKLAGYQPIVEVDEVEGGYMEVVEDLTKDQNIQLKFY